MAKKIVYQCGIWNFFCHGRYVKSEFSYLCNIIMNAIICIYKSFISSPLAFLWGSVHPFNQII